MSEEKPFGLTRIRQIALVTRDLPAAIAFYRDRLGAPFLFEVPGQLAFFDFGGIWLMVDEAHITTFAVDPAWRRQGIGERLLLALLDVAQARRAREATLEVRLSNVAARRLYEKYGFRPVGLRPNYYTDDGEDALIMTTEALDGPAMQARLAELRAALEAREGPDGPNDAAVEAAS